MAKKISQFLKDNQGMALGVAFSAPDLASLAKGENILKSIKNIMLNLVLGTGTFYYALGKTFSGLGNMVKGLITSTGSLNAAMKKLGAAESAQKSFTALGVSAAGAKAEIAKLAKMSSASGLRFEEVSEATQSLIALSRGAMGTADDMKRLIDVSKATGASLQGLAENAGAVSEAMRNGSEIDGAIDRLRTMGAISDSAASSLKNLQKAGAGAFSIQAGLDAAMGKKSAGRKDGIAEVEQQQEAAGKGAQAAAGKPWIEGDIESTKNYTEALKAMTPIIAQVSSFFASMFAYIGSWTSGLVKWAASFKLVRGGIAALIYVISALAAGLTFVMGIKFIAWLRSSSSAFGLMTTHIKTAGAWLLNFTGNARVARVAITAMNIALTATKYALIALQAAILFLTGFAIVGAILSSLVSNTAELAKEMDEAARASKDFNDELMLQANNIETLADKHALLQKALKASSDAWREVKEEEAKNKDMWWNNDADRARVASKRNAAEAIDRSVSSIAEAPYSQTAFKQREVDKALAIAQTGREIDESRATPEQQLKLNEKEKDRLSKLTIAGDFETTQLKDAQERASAVEIAKGIRRAEDAKPSGPDMMSGPERRASEVSKTTAALAKVQRETDAWQAGVDSGFNTDYNTKKLAEAQVRLRAAKDEATKAKEAEAKGADMSDLDMEQEQIYQNSKSEIAKGEGILMEVARKRKNTNLTTDQRAALSAAQTQGELLIKKGTKAKDEVETHRDAKSKLDEKDRQDKIKSEYSNKEADAQTAIASNMSEGHQLYMLQSDAELAAIARKIEEYKKLHGGVNDLTDSYIKNQKNAATAIRVAQVFQEMKHREAMRDLDTSEQEADDTSIGQSRNVNDEQRAQKTADDDVEAERKHQEALKKEDAANKNTKGYETQANDEKLRGLVAIQKATANANKESAKQREFSLITADREMETSDAEARGDSDTMIRNEDISVFQQKLESLRNLNLAPGVAEARANKFAENAIKIDGNRMARETEAGAAASSLARIGGGGGVEAADAQLDVTKRIAENTALSAQYLAQINGAGAGGIRIE